MIKIMTKDKFRRELNKSNVFGYTRGFKNAKDNCIEKLEFKQMQIEDRSREILELNIQNDKLKKTINMLTEKDNFNKDIILNYESTISEKDNEINDLKETLKESENAISDMKEFTNALEECSEYLQLKNNQIEIKLNSQSELARQIRVIFKSMLLSKSHNISISKEDIKKSYELLSFMIKDNECEVIG